MLRLCVLIFVVAVPTCLTMSRAGWEMKLRDDLKNRTDNITPPIGKDGDRSPVDVTVGLNIYKISDIQIGADTMEINAWLRLSWNDPRLTWSPSSYGGVNQTTFYAEQMHPVSEIWIPDLELYTQTASAYEAARKGISVGSDGSAFLSRPSLYKILCSFTDVQNFPYDKPCCVIDMGGWSQSGLTVNYLPGKLEFTTTSAFNEDFVEFSANVPSSGVTSSEYFFECCPNEPWPVISFNVCAVRSSSPYVRTIILPNIFITALSFLILWMDPCCGERLGYSATLLIALVATDFITVNMIPLTNTVLWIEILSSSSLAFTVASALLSILTAYFSSKWSREITRAARETTVKEQKRRETIMKMKGRKALGVGMRMRHSSLIRKLDISDNEDEGGDDKDSEGELPRRGSGAGNTSDTSDDKRKRESVRKSNRMSRVSRLSTATDTREVDVDMDLEDYDEDDDDGDYDVPLEELDDNEKIQVEAALELNYLNNSRHVREPQLLKIVQPVRFLGRSYLHLGKALDVYGRVILPAVYVIILAWLYAIIIDDENS